MVFFIAATRVPSSPHPPYWVTAHLAAAMPTTLKNDAQVLTGWKKPDLRDNSAISKYASMRALHLVKIADIS